MVCMDQSMALQGYPSGEPRGQRVVVKEMRRVLLEGLKVLRVVYEILLKEAEVEHRRSAEVEYRQSAEVPGEERLVYPMAVHWVSKYPMRVFLVQRLVVEEGASENQQQEEGEPMSLLIFDPKMMVLVGEEDHLKEMGIR